MTDTTTAFNNIVAWSRRLVDDLENIKTLGDMIGADSVLSAALADAATKAGRTDLTTANFDDWKVFVDLVLTLLNATNGTSVPVEINTGGAAKLAIYRIV